MNDELVSKYFPSTSTTTSTQTHFWKKMPQVLLSFFAEIVNQEGLYIRTYGRRWYV